MGGAHRIDAVLARLALFVCMLPRDRLAAADGDGAGTAAVDGSAVEADGGAESGGGTATPNTLLDQHNCAEVHQNKHKEELERQGLWSAAAEEEFRWSEFWKVYATSVEAGGTSTLTTRQASAGDWRISDKGMAELRRFVASQKKEALCTTLAARRRQFVLRGDTGPHHPLLRGVPEDDEGYAAFWGVRGTDAPPYTPPPADDPLWALV